MESLDNYLQPRILISDNVENQYLLEVGGLCPLCGKKLLIQKGKRANKRYQIAHIYLNSPNNHQKMELDGLERLGETCEDFENKIALCRDCHSSFDDYTTKEEYLKIVQLKKQLLQANEMQTNLSAEEVEEELLSIIEKLSVITEEDLRDINLKYKGIKVADKIKEEYFLLKRKIEFNVCTYYNFIQENMKIMSDKTQFNFDLLASTIKKAYLKASKITENQVMIFNMLVSWLESKITQVSRESCEIMISFFVQNCEVFDEITQ